MARTQIVPIQGTYTPDNNNQMNIIVGAIAGRGTSGIVYRTGDVNAVIKIYTQGTTAEEIDSERRNLAQIGELYGIYTLDTKPVLNLMRAHVGARLKTTKIYKDTCEPVNDVDLVLGDVNALIDLAMNLTRTNMMHYLQTYHLLHTDVKDRNVLFTLDMGGKPVSAQLIDWGDALNCDDGNGNLVNTDNIDWGAGPPQNLQGMSAQQKWEALVERRVNDGFEVLKDDADRRWKDADKVRKHNEKKKQEKEKKNVVKKLEERPEEKKLD
ncbi:hypothetical protein DL96DRAFT_1625166, partial [Flagelloscypha sp. PMI_526]